MTLNAVQMQEAVRESVALVSISVHTAWVNSFTPPIEKSLKIPAFSVMFNV